MTLGNLNALRDWGHAKDYVEMQWLMLQQTKPEDYVIATGQQHSVRDFVNLACEILGITLAWEGEGLDEVGKITKVKKELNTQLKVGDIIVKVDKKYYRAAEVETLLGRFIKS